MITKIGIVAGEIWHYLDENGVVKLPDLCKGISRKKDVVLMSLGWLAREGHILLQFQGNEYQACLRQIDPAKDES
ncbi:MAG: winged helix-turn-helix domain-containing protein [Candidatus Omnitrophica bacterium]|nr:winged helix-turn-helix domain-containing protein [Candidatus Omnitrophota bacterium]MDD5080612.1 winged helix-turn-helix domain-containing protein [Candidatus Omnitrophota bacterium]MDD5441143.1 winged helix-turn-helix domain-containing protein [Candidatus Omnitrophota bacterium]